MGDIKKEVEVLKQIAKNWERGYETWIIKGDDNEYVYEEFREEIFTHIVPYIDRLVKIEYLTSEQADGLMVDLLSEIERLKKYAES